jgi:urocanate hydratase
MVKPCRAGTDREAAMECKTWQAEAALRCLRNNLHPDVAERPEDLVVYGGSGKAARNRDCLAAIERSLRTLGPDETLLVQSGKPVAVFRTFEHAPRVLIANSLLVPDWATWEDFWALEAQGLTMYGQMTAGSWIYIGTQGILQGTFQTFAALAEQRSGGSLRGKVVLTAGLGGMGGAQPLAITMNDGVALCVEVDPARARRRIETRYLDELADSLDEAVASAREAADAGEARSIGVIANAADAFPTLLERGEPIDVVTDQTSAHDPLHGYIPRGLTLEEATELRAAKPEEYVRRARESMARHCQAMVGFQKAGAEVFDYGNNLRGEAKLGGFDDAFAYPGFVPAYIRPLFCEGKGPFRWVALSGEPADIAATDRAVLELFPDDDKLHRWIEAAQERVAFQGLPARICWLGQGERDAAGLAFNDLVASGAQVVLPGLTDTEILLRFVRDQHNIR